MKRKNNIFKRLFFILLFALFLPFILLFLFVKFIAKHTRYKYYQKNKVNGRRLILSTSYDELWGLEDFELVDFFKYFFFYLGYSVKIVSRKLNKVNLIITKNDNDILVKYDITRKHALKRNLQTLIQSMQKNNMGYGLFITNSEVDDSFLLLAKTNNVEVIDGIKLNQMIQELNKNLRVENAISDNVYNKSIDQLIDEMYPNKI